MVLPPIYNQDIHQYFEHHNIEKLLRAGVDLVIIKELLLLALTNVFLRRYTKATFNRFFPS